MIRGCTCAGFNAVSELPEDSWAKPEAVNQPKLEAVNHPAHYGGGDNPYEVVKVVEAWGLDQDAYLFNTVKYVARAGKKDPTKLVEDLEKARFYLDRRIAKLRADKKG